MENEKSLAKGSRVLQFSNRSIARSPHRATPRLETRALARSLDDARSIDAPTRKSRGGSETCEGRGETFLLPNDGGDPGAPVDENWMVRASVALLAAACAP